MSLIISLTGRKNEYDIKRLVTAVNAELREIGILTYEFTPKAIPEGTVLPWLRLRVSDLDYLKFIAAKLKKNLNWVPPSSFVNQPIPFDLKQKFIEENKSHLICHSSYCGGYIPVKFRNLSLPPQWLSTFGSSINLCNELKEIAGRLKLELGVYTPDLVLLYQHRSSELENEPIGFEKMLLLYLYNFCLASIKYGLIINFSG